MARTRHDSAFQEIIVSERSKTRFRSEGLILGIWLLLLPVNSLAETVLPTGGSVAQGSVDIGAPSGGNLTIRQNSDRAVVNWDSFSIGEGAHVGFKQPSSGSAILNRVTGTADSRIHGSLTANGQVFVVNPNGIFIGRNGSVTAGGGFVASTLDMRDDDFMAGRLRFEGDGNSAPVSNAGQIRIGRGGYGALMGGRVSNSGVVTVPLGRIGFAAGELVTLDVSGDQFLQVAIPSDSDDAEMQALIENSGRVSAEGGLIEMRAATARDAARQAINMSGVAEARSVSLRNGAIVLGGGAGGTVRVTGRVTTQARAPRPQRAHIQLETSLRPKLRPNGGDITITGAQIVLTGATLDASGAAGGEIRIGGDYQGGGTLPTAQRVSVDKATVITANAEGAGDGGRVILWSDLSTAFDGQIAARGGESGGDGGFVEVSGKQMLTFAGRVDTRAPQGNAGMLLLDPVDVTIGGSETTGIFENGNDFEPDGTCCSSEPSSAVITVDALEQNLGTGNVTVRTGTPSDGLSGNGDITVAESILWSSANTLTLEALGDIAVNADVEAANGSFVLTSPGSVSLGGGGFMDVGSLSVSAENLFVDDYSVNELGGGGTVDVGTFSMASNADADAGVWQQNAPTLSAFSADNFILSDASTFLRVTGGNGTTTPYQLTDIYGLQGVDSASLLDRNFVLANDIDANGTKGWSTSENGPAGFDPIRGTEATGFSGTLDGQGYRIDGLFIDTDLSGKSSADDAGLFALTDGATISDLTMTNVNVKGGPRVGALVAHAIDSTIERVRVDGNVSLSSAAGEDVIIGGLVGLNEGLIRESSSAANVTYTEIPSGSEAPTSNVFVGGFVGTNFGAILRSSARGSVEATGTDVIMAVGGHTGLNLDGTITDSYAVNSSVSAATDNLQGVGGFVGATSGGSIARVFAASPVSASGSGTTLTGGLVGANGNVRSLSLDATTAVSGSYWDVDRSGQPDLAVPDSGIGLRTAQFRDTEGFITRAAADGWNFAQVWAPGNAGNDPALYAIDPVIYAQPNPVTLTYGTAGTTPVTGAIRGGPGSYVFGPASDSLDTSDAFADPVYSDVRVGTRRVTVDPGTRVSSGGQSYRGVAGSAEATITRAPLRLTPNDLSKPFGTLLSFDGTEFTASGLVYSDAVNSLTLSSAGSAATAGFAGSPYAINGSTALGTGLENYDIVYGTGALSVTGGALTEPPPIPPFVEFDRTDATEFALPNARDDIRIGFGVATTSALDTARQTLALVQSFAATLEIAADACAQSLADTDRYLACLSDALDDFANELDAISTDLPPGMENVATIVRTARAQTDRARARATARLAGASTDAERDEIRRDALNEARAAMDTASAEIRKAITFARADDPELAALQSATVSTVAAAVDSVGIKLSRAVGL